MEKVARDIASWMVVSEQCVQARCGLPEFFDFVGAEFIDDYRWRPAEFRQYVFWKPIWLLFAKVRAGSDYDAKIRYRSGSTH